ncbi:MAG: 30S ribosomal protein S4 [Candidatus Berkelbacteria bacterium]|nr:30S ribosomal protein S4 [Candidatus Berkelbacteria bacterium]MCR4307620.1 30S ribosomal protein S4 [Candidatus Berkelbacteria bacterium]
MLQKQQQQRRRKITEYGYQLQEKQKAKQAYGLRERQFRLYYASAAKNRSETGNTLLQTLESRIDNVIFRSGLAISRPQARQLVSHRHFALNGKRVSIPSILVTPGDVITPNTAKTVHFEAERGIAPWLDLNKKSLTITVERLPSADELPLEFDTQKIVQFYSR